MVGLLFLWLAVYGCGLPLAQAAGHSLFCGGFVMASPLAQVFLILPDASSSLCVWVVYVFPVYVCSACPGLQGVFKGVSTSGLTGAKGLLIILGQ